MKIKSNKGGILLLALLVMTGILTVGLVTAYLIINEIQQSSQIEKSIMAYYGAESGMERSLYRARQQSFDVDIFNYLSAVLDNNTSYQIIAEDTENVIYRTLLPDESFQLDLYNPESLTPLDPVIKSLIVNWTDDIGAWLEVRWVPWTTMGILNPNPEVDWEERGKKLSPAGSYTINLLDNDIYLYKVRFTARNAIVSNLEIKAYNEMNPVENCDPLTDCQVEIPGWIKIKSVGEFPNNIAGAAKQAILISMPEKPPLAGLYDYVLFSEEEIVKENY